MDNRLILLNGKISDIARLRSMKGNIFEGKLSEYHYKEYLLANRLIAILKGMGLLQPGDILARYISAYPEMAPEIWDAVNMLKSYNEGILLKRKTLCYIILQETRGTICSNACFIILLHREGLVTEANLVKAGKIYSWWARFHYTFLDGLTFQNSQNELIKLVTFSDVIKYDNGNHSIDYIIDLCYQLLKKKIHDRIYYIMLLANPEHALYLQ